MLYYLTLVQCIFQFAAFGAVSNDTRTSKCVNRLYHVVVISTPTPWNFASCAVAYVGFGFASSARCYRQRRPAQSDLFGFEKWPAGKKGSLKAP